MSGSLATHHEKEILRLPVDSEEYIFNGWKISYSKSHILKSICTNNKKCILGDDGCCELCHYELTLNLPHLPDMVFHKNIMSLSHKNGARLEFNPMDALRRVESGKPSLQVACAEEWQESRPSEHMEKKIKPFDWTFTTDYQGTWNDKFQVEPTDIKLDITKLMKREEILFYHDLCLFEDELHDNGIASCTVKVRVMPSGFFILHRFFMRLDNVMIRMNDTRYHYEIENDFIIKEYTSREAKVEELDRVPPALFTIPTEIEKHLPIKEKTTEKLIFVK